MSDAVTPLTPGVTRNRGGGRPVWAACPFACRLSRVLRFKPSRAIRTRRALDRIASSSTDAAPTTRDEGPRPVLQPASS